MSSILRLSEPLSLQYYGFILIRFAISTAMASFLALRQQSNIKSTFERETDPIAQVAQTRY